MPLVISMEAVSSPKSSTIDIPARARASTSRILGSWVPFLQKLMLMWLTPISSPRRLFERPLRSMKELSPFWKLVSLAIVFPHVAKTLVVNPSLFCPYHASLERAPGTFKSLLLGLVFAAYVFPSTCSNKDENNGNYKGKTANRIVVIHHSPLN